MNAVLAKELLSAVPKEDFLTDRFTDEVGKCCAVGHLARLTSDDPTDFAVENCADIKGSFLGSFPREEKQEVYDFVRISVGTFLTEKHDIEEGANLANVNNFDDVNGYNQDNPKDRVIALLDDMIKEGL